MPTQTDTQPVSLRLEPQLITHLRRIARYQSYERDADVTYSDLIREAILQVYPLPKESDADTDPDDSASCLQSQVSPYFRRSL